jgi:glyoxylase-like metal-dependent hydrolase (beta-lactamase superfamily II)
MKTVKTGENTQGVYALDFRMVNSYLLKTEKGYVAIDAGLDPEKVQKELQHLGISENEVHAVLLTHSDGDHTGGIGAFPNAKIYLPELEVQMIDGRTKRKLFGRERSNSLLTPYKTVKTNESFQIEGLDILAVPVPGHTPGSTAYVINDRYVFTGDIGIIQKGNLKVSTSIFNNDHAEAEATITGFNSRYGDLELIATSHGGIRRRKDESQ